MPFKGMAKVTKEDTENMSSVFFWEFVGFSNMGGDYIPFSI